jgi:hypothetical protein
MFTDVSGECAALIVRIEEYSLFFVLKTEAIYLSETSEIIY